MSHHTSIEESPLFPLVAVPEVVTVCMYCQKHKNASSQVWEEPTEKIIPGASHGVCPDCYWGAVTDMWCDMREVDAEASIS